MKFDPSIIFFVIIVFFVLPLVLKKIIIGKRIRKISDTSVSSERSSVPGMKTEAKTRDVFETGSKKSSILEKIVLNARQFMQEARKRAEEQRQLQQQNPVNLKNPQGQNQAGKAQDTIWDILAERADDDFDESGGSIVSQNTLIRKNSKSLHSAAEKSQQDEAMNLAYAAHLRDDIHPIKSIHNSDGLAPEVPESGKTGYIQEGISPIKDKSSLVRQKDRGTVSDQKYRFKTDPLQNAVIWSEILSKPVALKENY